MSDGIKHDQQKASIKMLPPHSLGLIREVCNVFAAGAKKYGRDNWMLVEPARYEDALMRHTMAYIEEQTHDQESGSTHLAHIVANAMILYHADVKNGALG